MFHGQNVNQTSPKMLEFFVSLLSKYDDHSTPLNLKAKISDYKQQSYFTQIVSKKAKITKLSFMKNNKKIGIWFLVLCIWFQYIQRIEHKKPKIA